ncbi:MAG: GlcNAc-PI de-N-acetylase [Candidatus Tectimicrobiota bacterium]|nr:MAG: GlcNAc-PI de-N-acetylase [Candidatus Tectomicrobia bacterium]
MASEVVVVVFGAHPDDLDWGSGGTVARWAREGKEVYYVLATSGENGEDHLNGRVLPAPEMAELRQAEQRQAAAVLGVKDVIFLGQPDGKVQPSLAFRDQIVNVLRRLRPHIVVSLDPGHWAFDNFRLYHPDHRAMALAVYDAIYPAAGTATYRPQPDEGWPPHKVREVYFTGSSHPDTYVDITHTIDLKIQALSCHRSQITNPVALAQHVREVAARYGERIGCRYAEAFRRLDVPQ